MRHADEHQFIEQLAAVEFEASSNSGSLSFSAALSRAIEGHQLHSKQCADTPPTERERKVKV
jgi:hypothetical protein